jgi:hypothetical protein
VIALLALGTLVQREAPTRNAVTTPMLELVIQCVPRVLRKRNHLLEVPQSGLTFFDALSWMFSLLYSM